MTDCVFAMTPATAKIAKKGQQVHFTMIPPNQICSVSCSSSGDIRIVQCGGDGSVTAEATTDDAQGAVFVTKTCTGAVPEAGIVACGPTTVAIPIGKPKRNDAKLIIIWIIFGACLGAGYLAGGLVAGLPGMAAGAPAGALLGFGLAMLISWIVDP